MKILILIIFLIFTQSVLSQNDTLYLMIEKPFIQGSKKTNYLFSFSINSKDKRFVCDYYRFSIPSYQGWNDKGEDIYFDLKKLRDKISIDSLKFETLESLNKNKDWWQIHNELSLKKKIYLLEKRNENFNPETKEFDCAYYILPMIYEGTRKNIVPTDLSNKRE